MVVDTSAIVAILKQEPGHEKLAQAIYFTDDIAYMSAANLLETFMVVMSNQNDPTAWNEAEEFITLMGIEIVSLTFADIKEAMLGFSTYGKGRHPAKLNYGDCFSYGLAKSRNEPLLFVGDDFSKTDLTPAL